MISGRKCCRLAVMGAVEGYIIFFSGNWWGRGGRREKFWSSQMPEFFDVSESLCLKRISPHITGELYPNRFVLKEFNLEIASERNLWAIWAIYAVIHAESRMLWDERDTLEVGLSNSPTWANFGTTLRNRNL